MGLQGFVDMPIAMVVFIFPSRSPKGHNLTLKRSLNTFLRCSIIGWTMGVDVSIVMAVLALEATNDTVSLFFH